jgi:hypothetical protein
MFSQCIDSFVDELRWEEHDTAKRDKIRDMKLSGDEWERVNTFLGLLSVRLFFRIHIYTLMLWSARGQRATSLLI